MADYAALIQNSTPMRVYLKYVSPKVVQVEGSEHGCWHCALAATKGNRNAPQIRINGNKYYTHIIACMSNEGRAPRLGEEASHLCNNPRCVNPSHLTFESGDINKSRIFCRLFRTNPKFLGCLHEPRCLGCE